MIKETAKVFELGISHDVPEEMKEYLKKDAFIFSGLKTNAQLQEARSLLKDENGHIRPYYLFEKDVLKLNEKYNLNYLDAEYQFAQASSQSAANWANLSDSERYNLQYRTAGDERVRESHNGLNGTTLPKNSAFWISYYPPNGWRCRCIAVLVLASKYPASDVDKATAAAEKATTQIGKNGKNKLEMFRFNPGMEKKIFPPNNSYSKVVGADKVKEIIKEKPEEYEQLTMGKLENLQAKQIIDKEKETIIMGNFDGYVGTSNSFYLNRKLRSSDILGDEDLRTVTALDDLIKANKLSSNIILHRNVNLDFIESHFTIPETATSFSDLVKAMKESDVKTFSDKGFCSTSAVKSVNVFQDREIVMEIRAKAGTNAFITDNFEESEVILARNQQMKIVDIESLSEGKVKIIVEAN